MRITLTVFLVSLTLLVHGQQKKTYFPAWTFQQKNINIYGVSAGLWNFTNDPQNTSSNGLRFSLIGEGIVVALAPRSPIAESDNLFQSIIDEPISERVNGISLPGTGNAGSYEINGVAIGLVGHLHNSVNGISVAAMINAAQRHNGIQTTLFTNQCYQMNGIQVGIFNTSKKTRGFQIGLWNVNERRKLPLINWNFGSKNS
ncbi:hypothetical protein D3C86_1448220 [compost metagenome]